MGQDLEATLPSQERLESKMEAEPTVGSSGQQPPTASVGQQAASVTAPVTAQKEEAAAKGPERGEVEGAQPAGRRRRGTSATAANPSAPKRPKPAQQTLVTDAKTSLATLQTVTMQTGHIQHGVESGSAEWQWAKAIRN